MPISTEMGLELARDDDEGFTPSERALFLTALFCPSMTWYAMTNFLMPNSDPLIGFLTIVLSYGFAVLAMLVPAISEFDVAVGRTVADEG